MRTFKVPFTVSLMGYAEIDADTYQEAVGLAKNMKLQVRCVNLADVWLEAMNVETADKEPEGDDA